MILPLVAELLARVGRRPAVEESIDALRRAAAALTAGQAAASEARLSGLTDPAKALVAALVEASLGRPVILLTESNQRAEELVEPLRFFYRALSNRPASRVTAFPAHDVLPYSGMSPHPEISEARAVALWRFTSGEADIVVAPASAALQRLREADFYRGLAAEVAHDQEISLDALLAHLASVGYERSAIVEMPGQFAVRGGIVDAFSPESPRPIRLELVGDTVESLREFDPSSQRSTGPIGRAILLPLTDYPRRADGLTLEEDSSAPDFSPGWEFRTSSTAAPDSHLLVLNANACVIEDEPELLATAIEAFQRRLREAYENTRDNASAPIIAPPDRFFLSADEWLQAVARVPRLALERLGIERPDESRKTLLTQPTTRYHGNIAAFMAEVRGRLEADEQVIVSGASTGELERLADICHEYELPYRLGELEESATVTRLAEDSSGGSVPAVVLIKSPLSEGVVIPDCRLVFYGSGDIFATLPAPARAKRRAKTASFFSDFSDLKAGDYVVHVDHGIGKFEGLREVAVDGVNGEFMLLHYADAARLYVPLARLDLVQKYQSLGGAVPQLDRLGGQQWEARKSRVRKSVSDLAQKLLALYAARKAGAGHSFPADTTWQKEFEDAFEFEETPDQARAIEDVKHDLELPLPMDRLLCGDVGYGKTEVAMRAAFKALSDSKQVAVLAPTTVLAFQHYETFKRRFAAFPVRIEMLSRFRSAREQKQTLEALEAGKVDVVIGTHRLLSKDVRFHDLGLLVVDEEQRFGVAHKERLKELRHNVDVLTMSATPIPRTLHMSFAGLRDMSVIETPPKDRLAIQTVVAPFQETLVQRAIEEELARHGQVFFVHNRVESIFSLASMVKRLVPKARVVVGHGQLKEADLEKVMLQFVRGDADVLVATTIIENGLDIPRANTILINRADRLGLAELYQLRGRVGRSNQRAYAYLLVPPEGSLSSLARQRLAALKEFSDLGAGFRIAALDLELRGAGNLLGREQHGHIGAVGFDMYCQMLERAVAQRKGEAVKPELRATLNLGLDIRIPPEYIESENLRLRIYKRVAGVSSEEEQAEVRRELEDRFGPPPPAVLNLLDYAALKGLCEKMLVASIERRGDQLAIKFHDETPVKPERVVKLLRAKKGLRLDPTGLLWVAAPRERESVTQAARNVLLQLQP
jgi:transcription-repair coupling factor (superfamily II helicase)